METPLRTGFLKGAVSFPILFNFYLSNLPTIPDGITLIQYADDISIYTQGTNVDALSEKVNAFMSDMADFLEECNLVVSTEKSTVTWFTPASREANVIPKITIKVKAVKLEKTLKLLGITYDTCSALCHTSERPCSKPR